MSDDDDPVEKHRSPATWPAWRRKLRITSRTQALVGIAVAAALLFTAGLYGLFVLPRAIPPEPDLPTHTPPPTFTTTASPTPRPTLTGTPSPTPTPVPTPIVVDWRELGHLAVDEYTAATVVEVERKGFWGSDRVLLEVTGKIQIGVDMTQIQGSDVTIDGTSVSIVLPHVRVTTVELLPDRSIVYDSQRKWLFSEYTGIEVEALDRARIQLYEWATHEERMLSRSEMLARFQLEAFLRNLGFERIEIAFEE